MKGMISKLILDESITYNDHIVLDKLRISCIDHDVPDFERNLLESESGAIARQAIDLALSG